MTQAQFALVRIVAAPIGKNVVVDALPAVGNTIVAVGGDEQELHETAHEAIRKMQAAAPHFSVRYSVPERKGQTIPADSIGHVCEERQGFPHPVVTYAVQKIG